ncbi:MAG: manganese-binding transcriptional regulator MntR [Pedosphaera sp.]|nr:manganese-binding transcriptional regulator MntR [Pedosphaera sp.]
MNYQGAVRSIKKTRASERTTEPPGVRPSDLQAASLKQTRQEHANELAEDYVEAIADLGASQREARVVDLARRLGVTHVTVNRTVARLQQAGFVTSQPYRAIFLTEQGQKLAAQCKQRHEIVVAFLRSLGISERVAEIDAEGIEHHVSPETLAAFKRFLKSPRPRAPNP